MSKSSSHANTAQNNQFTENFSKYTSLLEQANSVLKKYNENGQSTSRLGETSLGTEDERIDNLVKFLKTQEAGAGLEILNNFLKIYKDARTKALATSGSAVSQYEIFPEFPEKYEELSDDQLKQIVGSLFFGKDNTALDKIYSVENFKSNVETIYNNITKDLIIYSQIVLGINEPIVEFKDEKFTVSKEEDGKEKVYLTYGDGKITISDEFKDNLAGRDIGKEQFEENFRKLSSYQRILKNIENKSKSDILSIIKKTILGDGGVDEDDSKADKVSRSESSRSINEEFVKKTFEDILENIFISHMKKELELAKQKDEAATKIQAVVRGMLARNEVGNLKNQKELEEAQERNLERFKEDQKKQKEEAATKIQAFARERLARNKKLEEAQERNLEGVEEDQKKQKEEAAIKIQAVGRGMLARNKKLEEAQKRNLEGVEEDRGRKIEEEEQDQRKQSEEEAAIKIQALIRGKLARKKKLEEEELDQRKQSEEEAAIKIQALIRGKLARNEVDKMKPKKDKKVSEKTPEDDDRSVSSEIGEDDGSYVPKESLLRGAILKKDYPKNVTLDELKAYLATNRIVGDNLIPGLFGSTFKSNGENDSRAGIEILESGVPVFNFYGTNGEAEFNRQIESVRANAARFFTRDVAEIKSLGGEDLLGKEDEDHNSLNSFTRVQQSDGSYKLAIVTLSRRGVTVNYVDKSLGGPDNLLEGSTLVQNTNKNFFDLKYLEIIGSLSKSLDVDLSENILNEFRQVTLEKLNELQERGFLTSDFVETIDESLDASGKDFNNPEYSFSQKFESIVKEINQSLKEELKKVVVQEDNPVEQRRKEKLLDDLSKNGIVNIEEVANISSELLQERAEIILDSAKESSVEFLPETLGMAKFISDTASKDTKHKDNKLFSRLKVDSIISAIEDKQNTGSLSKIEEESLKELIAAVNDADKVARKLNVNDHFEHSQSRIGASINKAHSLRISDEEYNRIYDNFRDRRVLFKNKDFDKFEKYFDRQAELPAPVEDGISILKSANKFTATVTFTGNPKDDVVHLYLPGTDNCYVAARVCTTDGQKMKKYVDGKLTLVDGVKGQVYMDENTLMHFKPCYNKYGNQILNPDGTSKYDYFPIDTNTTVFSKSGLAKEFGDHSKVREIYNNFKVTAVSDLVGARIKGVAVFAAGMTASIESPREVEREESASKVVDTAREEIPVSPIASRGIPPTTLPRASRGINSGERESVSDHTSPEVPLASEKIGLEDLPGDRERAIRDSINAIARIAKSGGETNVSESDLESQDGDDKPLPERPRGSRVPKTRPNKGGQVR